MEEEITGLIVEAIEKKLDAPFLPERLDRYSVGEEKPIAVEGRTGKRRRRLDLVVISGQNRPRPKYIFEAKRLRKNGYSISRYLCEDGLQCYINRVYASQYPEAAMIAYVQSDTLSYWENELKRSFDNDLNNSFCVKQALPGLAMSTTGYAYALLEEALRRSREMNQSQVGAWLLNQFQQQES